MRLHLPVTIGIGTAVFLTITIGSDAHSKPSADIPSVMNLRGSPVSSGSAIALADLGGRTVAFVADEDEQTVRVFDTQRPPKEIAAARVPGVPSQIAVTRDGRVLVAIRDKGQVAILEPKGGDVHQLVQRSSIDVGGEPVALSLTPDGETLVVASGWTHEVSGYAMSDRSRKFRLDVAREPRSIAVDAGRAYVTHAVGGTITTIELATGTTLPLTTTAVPNAGAGLRTAGARGRLGTQGFAIAANGNRVFAPVVYADPTPPETYYGAGLETLGVVVVDETTASIVDGSRAYTTGGSFERCILPRAAIATADGKYVAVGCAGDSDVLVLDASSDAPRGVVKSTRNVGDAPSALAFDESTRRLVAWSQMGRTLAVTGITEGAGALEVARAAAGTMPASVARGRRLFHAVDGRTASDGRACASCHTDGRDDGFVWTTPEGPRQTPMLAGRLEGTAPFGWTRDAKTFHDYVRGTAQRLRGRGFTNAELDDLSAYVMSLKAPPRATADAALVKRGTEVFTASGCASCHKGATTTDNLKHPVVGALLNVHAGSGSFATPSLRFVGGTAPYFHDGRYPTLRALLTSNDPNMGTGKNLPAADLDALEAYLRSL